MIRRLQTALRKDRLVQDAVAQAHQGKAIRVWNGGWVRHGEQEGAGLAAVREAIMWEVGFAPEACRKEAVHGPILISLNEEHHPTAGYMKKLRKTLFERRKLHGTPGTIRTYDIRLRRPG